MDALLQTSVSKPELLLVAKGLRTCEPAAIDRAVAFLVQDSRGTWHNRARAKFARRLKHCPLSPAQSLALVDSIIARLTQGSFSEQFADQLRLALLLDRQALLSAATKAQDSPLPHVQRYADWVVACHGAGLRPSNSSKPNPHRGSSQFRR
jgi:hypothetical protein